MTTVSARLQAIITASEEATQGPWRTLTHRGGDVEVRTHDGLFIANCGPTDLNGSERDADLTALARNEAPVLAHALNAVLELHQPSADGQGCDTDMSPWPCPTVHAITTTMGEQ